MAAARTSARLRSGAARSSRRDSRVRVPRSAFACTRTATGKDLAMRCSSTHEGQAARIQGTACPRESGAFLAKETMQLARREFTVGAGFGVAMDFENVLADGGGHQGEESLARVGGVRVLVGENHLYRLPGIRASGVRAGV